MRMARSTGAVSGLLIVLLGIWGALVPFIGPYFDYSFGVNSAWHYTTDRLWLDILPGAVAVAGGLLVFTARTRTAGALGGWLAVLAGAWFAVGPAVGLTWEHGSGPIGPPLYGTTRQALELVGYFYGLGAVIVGLGAFAIGRFASRPPLAEEPALARGALASDAREAPPRRAAAEGAPQARAGEANAGQAPARGAAAEGRRRRLPLRRRGRETVER
jgi:hypothetical protein